LMSPWLCCNPARTVGLMIIIAIALALFLGLVGVTLAGARVRRVLRAEQLSDEWRLISDELISRR
jgi:hypothetical protein